MAINWKSNPAVVSPTTYASVCLHVEQPPTLIMMSGIALHAESDQKHRGEHVVGQGRHH